MMQAPDFDLVIVGGGVVGLACAAELAGPGRNVLLLEGHRRFGQETSSRNSGVIHAGLYYPPDSLKAQLCVEGRKLVYARCEGYGIDHQKCGKLVVATSEAEAERLHAIMAQGQRNGAGELSVIGAEQVRKLEPRVRAVAALVSPETGVVDAHGLMNSYAADARRGGAQLLTGTRVTALQRTPGGYRVSAVGADGETTEIETSTLVNAAGLHADRIAGMLGVDIDAAGLRLHYCKGDYFALSPRLGRLTRHLVYPVPVLAGLGTHVTFDLGGQFHAGPDAEYVDDIRYAVDPAKAAAFGDALRRYLPEVQDEDLSPGYAGMRPKLQAPGEGFADFVVAEATDLGLPGFVNLVGIESPGLTASEAIAKRVARLLAC